MEQTTTDLTSDDQPKYEGPTDPIPVIESALSYDAKSFEPKKYREANIQQFTETPPTDNTITTTTATETMENLIVETCSIIGEFCVIFQRQNF